MTTLAFNTIHHLDCLDGMRSLPDQSVDLVCDSPLYTADEVAELLAQASDVTHHLVGGGVMGDRLCHENEAPYPESLPEFFIRSFCPPGGIVLDRFSGSGTTCAVAKALGRQYIGFDVRESQVKLSKRRIGNVTPPLLMDFA